MNKLTFENSLEVHADWLCEVRHKLRMSYGDVNEFSKSNNIDYLAAFWFLKGSPVEINTFKTICDILDVDWQLIQLPGLWQ